MIAILRKLICVALLALAGFAVSAPQALAQESTRRQVEADAERAYPAAKPPYGIDAKRPVFGGACMGCPWGILGIATMQAMKPYGYDVQMCWVCHSTIGPRLMADKTKPDQSAANQDFVTSLMHAATPDAVPDISATSEFNLLDAYNGVGPYAEDKKKRQNYRVVAALQQANYLMAAVRADSGIKSLHDIKDRTRPTWIYADSHNAVTREVLEFYGITEEALKAKKGGLVHNVNPDMRAQADVFIHHGLLVNTPEQNVWYQATQKADLTFVDFDPKLLQSLATRPGYRTATMPAFGLKGLDHRIDTVMRTTHYIYVRDDAPDDFVYTLAKALDEQQEVFRMQALPMYYDIRKVGVAQIPLHPAATRYYKERGYIQ